MLNTMPSESDYDDEVGRSASDSTFSFLLEYLDIFCSQLVVIDGICFMN